MLGYFQIFATADRDVAGYSLAGGLHAPIEHPADLVKLRADPSLIPSVVGDIIRR